jgi:hypothetical protein
MFRPAALLICLALTVAGCSRVSNSWINPLNWFGSSTTVPTASVNGDVRPLVTSGQLAGPVDGRVLVTDVTGLVIEQTPDGAIIRATGIAPQQGYYNAQLVRSSFEDGVLTYEFRAEPPPSGASGGSVVGRTLNVATTVANTTLNAVRTVRVVGQTTTQVVTR